MSTFQLDSLRFDQHLSINKQERNIILSTGLNRRTVKKLARKVFVELIQSSLNAQKWSEETTLISQNTSAILCLYGIFNYYELITEKSIGEIGGVRDLQIELRQIVKESELSRNNKAMMDSFLSGYRPSYLAMMVIQKHLMTQTESIDSESKLQNMTAQIYAEHISRYLCTDRWATESITNTVGKEISRITQEK